MASFNGLLFITLLSFAAALESSTSPSCTTTSAGCHTENDEVSMLQTIKTSFLQGGERVTVQSADNLIGTNSDESEETFGNEDESEQLEDLSDDNLDPWSEKEETSFLQQTSEVHSIEEASQQDQAQDEGEDSDGISDSELYPAFRKSKSSLLQEMADEKKERTARGNCAEGQICKGDGTAHSDRACALEAINVPYFPCTPDIGALAPCHCEYVDED
eukprot:gnl/TRDRNA2_/TRDRNA2_174491_c0_seq1.p1 gnl/TRDRNA2_/TRDRNA2_174491_c0~~gnl/TRDRNA2_/TRDRNA2_174491_c0_seq1.p1  ORF type:complete len:217 (-),score=52.65 gnl/TRDRNA2_/TRDRNA2_174491_c0_seq1:157-807(-)